MATPTLPKDDPNPEQRAVERAARREIWQLDKSYHGLVFADADSVLRDLEYRLCHRTYPTFSWGTTLDIIAGLGLRETMLIAKHARQTKANAKAVAHLISHDGAPERLSNRVARAAGRLNQKVTDRIWHPEHPDGTPRPWSERQPLTKEQLLQTLATLPKPDSYAHWDEDAFFAWLRLAGQNPILLEWVPPGELASLQAKLPLTPERYAEARPDDTLDAADRDGRLFVIDLGILEGIETGVSYGWRKWMPPAVAVFALEPDRSQLWPVAIQCGQDPATTPYFTPADGEHWRLARYQYLASESNYHGVVEHGTLCHMLAGALAISARRNLAPNHPMMVLLEPHIERTVGVNLATKDLFEPGGLTPTLQSVSVRGTAQLSKKGWSMFDWTERSTEREFARRGVASHDVLPDYPFRDDSERVTLAIRRFATGYVEHYYPSDDAVDQDPELIDWFAELQAVDGPNAVEMPTIPRPRSRAELAAFFTNAIWRISPYHAVINYRVYDDMGFVLCNPTATYAPPPDPDVDYGPDDWLFLFAPLEGVDAAIADTWNVSNTRMNHLGDYGCYLTDPAVRPLVDAFHADLAVVEREITDHNLRRYVPFTTLLPSNLTNSIHI